MVSSVEARPLKCDVFYELFEIMILYNQSHELLKNTVSN